MAKTIIQVENNLGNIQVAVSKEIAPGVFVTLHLEKSDITFINNQIKELGK